MLWIKMSQNYDSTDDQHNDEIKDQERAEGYLALLQKVASMNHGGSQDASSPSQGFGWTPNNGSLVKKNGITFDADGNIQRVGPLSSENEEYLQQLSWLSKTPSAAKAPSEGNMAAGQSTWEPELAAAKEDGAAAEPGSPRRSSGSWSFATTESGGEQGSGGSRGIHASWFKPCAKAIVGVTVLAMITQCVLEHCMYPPEEGGHDWQLFRVIDEQKELLSSGWHKLGHFFSIRFIEDVEPSKDESTNGELASVFDLSPEFKRELLERIEQLETVIESKYDDLADQKETGWGRVEKRKDPSSSQIQRFHGTPRKQERRFAAQDVKGKETIFSRIGQKLNQWADSL